MTINIPQERATGTHTVFLSMSTSIRTHAAGHGLETSQHGDEK